MTNNFIRFEVLDSFRGIAAICVALSHMRYFGSIAEIDFFRGSWLFVEFFFVLSGFVLTHGYGFKENFTFKQFLISRTFRLFPLHVVMLIVFLFLELGKFVAQSYGYQFNSSAFTGSTAIKEILPNFLLLQAWTPYTVPSFNIPSWSISIEYYVYILFFITLFVVGTARAILWSGLIIILACLIINDIEFLTNWAERGLYSFFIGSLTYLTYLRMKSFLIKVSNYIFTFFEIICLMLVIFIVNLNVSYTGSIYGPLIFSITILTFSLEKGLISKFLKHEVFLFFGKLSYSIYMTHMMIWTSIMVFSLFTSKIFGLNMLGMIEGVKMINFGSSVINNLAVFMNLILIILVSKFTYDKIELRFQRIGKNLIN